MQHFELPLHHPFQRRGRVGRFLPNDTVTVHHTPLEPADRALQRKALWMQGSQRWLLLSLTLAPARLVTAAEVAALRAP